jgi:hypothetical protein
MLKGSVFVQHILQSFTYQISQRNRNCPSPHQLIQAKDFYAVFVRKISGAKHAHYLTECQQLIHHQ